MDGWFPPGVLGGGEKRLLDTAAEKERRRAHEDIVSLRKTEIPRRWVAGNGWGSGALKADKIVVT